MPDNQDQTETLLALEPTGLAEAVVPTEALSEPEVQVSIPPVVAVPEVAAASAEPPLVKIQEEVPSAAKQANDALYARILAARNAPPAVVPLQPPIPFMTEQTRKELAVGAKMNAHYENLKNQPRAVRKVIDLRATPESITPVHRPSDFVPKFNQGAVAGRPLT